MCDSIGREFLGKRFRNSAELPAWIAAADALQGLQQIFESVIFARRRTRRSVALGASAPSLRQTGRLKRLMVPEGDLVSVGPYRPHRYMQYTENDMRDRFNSQERYSAAFLEGYEVFEHIGAEVSHRRPVPIERVGRFIRSLPGVGSLFGRLRSRS